MLETERHVTSGTQASAQRRRFAPPAEGLADPLGRVFTDSRAEHQYRLDVAEALEAMGWRSRAIALRMCGRAAIQVDCTACGCPHLVPFRCGARNCPTCARSAAGAIVDRVSERVEVHDRLMESVDWDGAAEWDEGVHFVSKRRPHKEPSHWRIRRWRMVTVTRRTCDPVDPFEPAKLRAQVRESRALFRAWWRRTEWGRQKRDAGDRRKRSRRDTSYIVGVEVAPGGMVHMHAAVYGEYLQQSALLEAWRAVLPPEERAGVDADDPTGPNGGVFIEKIRDVGDVHKALREVLKYATKGQTVDDVEQMPLPYHAAAVECAFRHVRRCDVGGVLRTITADDALELHQDDLHDAHVAACQGCGVIGEWRWVGVRGQEYVDANGGFGFWTPFAMEAGFLPWRAPPPDRGFGD